MSQITDTSSTNNVGAPVLVIRGKADTIMSRADSEVIAQIVNQVHLGHARDFTVHDKFYDPLVATILNWIKEQLSENRATGQAVA